MQSSPLIEVCVGDFESAEAAARAGANRLEVNRRLDLDGLTPDDELVRRCVGQLDVPVIAMARPDSSNNRFEADGFVYSATDWERLLDDARRMLDLGVAGIAAGCLKVDGLPDESRLRQLREICAERELVFHRAFDVTTDWRAAFRTIVECGADRILTSGTAATAIEGTGVLRWMVARGEIEILPACGITCLNASLVVSETGCTQLHGSFSRSTTEPESRGDENTVSAAETVGQELGKLFAVFQGA